MKRHKFIFPKRYKKVRKNYFNQLFLKYLRNDISLNYFLRQRCSLELILTNKRNSLTRLKSFCIFTGRVKFTLTKFKISRMTLKTFMSLGYYSGLYKASW